NEDLAAPRRVRGSAILRGLLARAPTRSAVRGILLALRAAYYDLRIERALSRPRIAAWLRDALCVTAVVSVAPQLGDARPSGYQTRVTDGLDVPAPERLASGRDVGRRTRRGDRAHRHGRYRARAR